MPRSALRHDDQDFHDNEGENRHTGDAAFDAIATAKEQSTPVQVSKAASNPAPTRMRPKLSAPMRHIGSSRRDFRSF
jgi:hypothetical protein